MRRLTAVAALSLGFAEMLSGQGRPVDWPFFAGDAQRTGWEKSDSRITKDNVKDFQLVLKRKLETKLTGPRSLTPPVMIGTLISYKGFKELAFVSGASDTLWSIDVDTDRPFWTKHFEKPAMKKGGGKGGASAAMCNAMATATPSLTPAPNFGGGRGRGGAPTAIPGPPPAPPTGLKAFLGGGGFGAPRPVFALSGDGKLHLLNTSTGEDVAPAMQFVPSGAKGSSLTDSEGVIYTTTNWGCGGAPNGVWAIDLNGDAPKVTSYAAKSVGGVAFGAGGTVYTQTPESVLALAPKELTVKQTFAASGSLAETTPVLFTYKDRELAVSAGKDGTLYLLDTQALATPLSTTAPVGAIWGGLSSWQDTDGTRWVLAPVWGPVHASLGDKINNGAIVAFRLDESNGKLELTPAWVSRDMNSPEPPVITSGVVFALAAGGKVSKHATLYAMDATTGKEIYSTGDQVTAPANLTGLTIANGRVFFTTNDGTLYGFGVFMER